MDSKIAEVIHELKPILKECCLEIVEGKHNGDDFYRFISGEIYGNERAITKTRKLVCNFQKEILNQPYFQLFLPRSREDDIKNKNPLVLFDDDLGRSSRSNVAPTARDVSAVAELLGRRVCILTIDLDLNEYFEDDNIDLKWKIYQPVLHGKKDETKGDIKLLLVIKGDIVEFCKLKDISKPNDNTSVNYEQSAPKLSVENSCMPWQCASDTVKGTETPLKKATYAKSATSEHEGRDLVIPPLIVDSDRCHENKFENVLYVNDEKNIAGEIADGFDSWSPDLYLGEDHTLYRCVSREMYGTDDYWTLVKAHIISLEQNPDYVHVFAHFVSESEDAKQKEEDFKKHIEDLTADNKEPGRGEIFAAASLLYLDIYVLTEQNGQSVWQLYRPITNQLGLEEIMDSHITMSFDPNTGKYLRLLPFSGKRNRRCNTPDVQGNLIKLQLNISEVAQEVVARSDTCCGMNEYQRHMHFSSFHNIQIPTDLHPNLPNPFPDPPVSMRHVMKLLRAEGRMLDKIDDHYNTPFRCVSREVYGVDDYHESLHKAFLEQYPGSTVGSRVVKKGEDDTLNLQIMRNVVEWLGVSVYIYSKLQENSDIYDWTCFQPQSLSSTCRYYATWFYSKRNDKFDRIVPIKGCNCQLLPPVSLLADNSDHRVQDLILEIPSDKRHKRMLCYMSDKSGTTEPTTECRHPLIASQYSESYSVLYLREDMKDRFIDTVHQDRNSFYRCISKDTFGTEDYFSQIRESFLTRLNAKKPEYSELLKERSQIALDTVISRIENFSDAQDEELFLTATIMKTRIFVLQRKERDGRGCVLWKEFTSLQDDGDLTAPAARRSEDLDNGQVTQFDPLESIGTYQRCTCAGDGDPREFYLTLVKTSAGHYDRIVPKSSICNCSLPMPVVEEIVQENKAFLNETTNELHALKITRTVDESLSRLKIALNSWLQINEEVEKLCNQIIKELEERREKVSIATIAGGSGGLAGVGLAIGGIIAAPFTGGLSLGLTIAGAVLGGSGAITMAGAKGTELYLGNQAAKILEKKQKILEVRSTDLKDALEEVSKNVKRLETDIHGLVRDDSMSSLDTALISTIGSLLRAVKELYVIPLAVLRISSQSVALVSAILLPLAVIVDVGSIVHASVNLARGSKTNVSENLRRISAMLRSCRIQLQTWGYGQDGGA